MSFGDFTADEGVLVPNTDKEDLGVREPLPAKAEVKWRDAAGMEHREEVPVKPAGEFKGVLVFEIDDSNHARALMEAPPPHIQE